MSVAGENNRIGLGRRYLPSGYGLWILLDINLMAMRRKNKGDCVEGGWCQGRSVSVRCVSCMSLEHKGKGAQSILGSIQYHHQQCIFVYIEK